MSATHGTVSRYHRGCHCTDCRGAIAAYARDHVRRRAMARWGAAPPTYVDPAPVREHIETLRALGLGTREIARRAHVGRYTVERIIGVATGEHGPSTRIRPETATAILAVRADRLADRALIDATGSMRRLRALVALGWPQQQLADRIGWHIAALSYITRGRQRFVHQATADLIAALYDELSGQPGPSERVRALAAKRGWAPPLAWDDDEIDAPTARPRGLRRAA